MEHASLLMPPLFEPQQFWHVIIGKVWNEKLFVDHPTHGQLFSQSAPSPI